MNREHRHLDGKAESKCVNQPGLQVSGDIHLVELDDADDAGLNELYVDAGTVQYRTY